MKNENIEDGLYLLNDKRKLYYQENKWWKVTFVNGRYTGYIYNLEKQPKIIKSLIKLKE